MLARGEVGYTGGRAGRADVRKLRWRGEGGTSGQERLRFWCPNCQRCVTAVSANAPREESFCIRSLRIYMCGKSRITEFLCSARTPAGPPFMIMKDLLLFDVNPH